MGIGILSGQWLKVRVMQIKLLIEILKVLIAMEIDSQQVHTNPEAEMVGHHRAHVNGEASRTKSSRQAEVLKHIALLPQAGETAQPKYR